MDPSSAFDPPIASTHSWPMTPDTSAADAIPEPGADGQIDQTVIQELAEQTTYGEVFMSDLIARQLTLSLAVAATFLGTIFAVPLFNLFVPAIANLRVLGFTVSWVFVGMLIYPIIWGLAYYFVGTAKKYEDEFTKMVQ